MSDGDPIYRAALEAAAVVPAMAAPGHWLVSDVDRIHDAILALPVPPLRDTLADLREAAIALRAVAIDVTPELEQCKETMDLDAALAALGLLT